MPAQEFAVLRVTRCGNALLESAENEKPAVARPTRVFLGRKHALTIFETIASVSNPFYLARPAKGAELERLVGKKVFAKL